MQEYSTVIIGGGAAGICAAISRARTGSSVIICEKTSVLGKKILASGNGRCNLLNDDFNEKYFNTSASGLVKSVLARYDKNCILEFFNDLGLKVESREGRVFPVTNQASSVLKVLEMEIKRLSVPVEYNFNCRDIRFSKKGITVISDSGKEIACRQVIVTGGGKTYPSYGSDGSMYEVARKLGHSIIEPIPCVVPLLVKDNMCFLLQGQKISAEVKSLIDGKTGTPISGELLFTKYGLSGTAILDVSEEISTAISRNGRKEVYVSVDMVPFMNREQLHTELRRRKMAGWANEDILVGILPNKLCSAVSDIFRSGNLDAAVNMLKGWLFKVSGTRGWNEAEFTSGGVNTSEIKPETLESKIRSGIYFAGEILDVNGQRGGYNLGWAWASGMLAGLTS